MVAINASSGLSIINGELAMNNRGISNANDLELNNGSSFYLPTVDLVKDTVEIEDADHTLFDDFMQWIKNYNVWVFNEFSKKAEEADKEIDGDDAKLVEQFVSVD